jgi:cytochrome c oxidase subunit 2
MGEERVKRTVRQMVVVGVIASALGIALGLLIDWFPVAGSKQAHKIDTLWDVLIIASVPIFVLVAVVVLFSVKTFRMRPGQEHEDGPPIHGNTTLEVVWTALPAILIVGLVTYAYIVLRDIEKAPANAAQELHVHVTGQQFTWTFQYQAPGGGKISSAQLYVPVNRSVKFDINSLDVIHDFWVPAWRVKIDAVPGITTHYRVTPIRLGTYPVVCAELCGLGHAFMRQTAHVLPEAKFNAWLSKMGGGAAAGGAPAAVDPKKLFTSGNAAGAAPCGSCHTLADAGTTATVGPDLDKFLKNKDAAFIRESIVKPNAYIEKGYAANIMPPNFGSTLSPAELTALVNYLVKVTHK